MLLKSILKNRNLLKCLLLFITWSLWAAPGWSQAADFKRETPVVKAVRNVSPAVVNISSSAPFPDSGGIRFSTPFSRISLSPALSVAINGTVSVPV